LIAISGAGVVWKKKAFFVMILEKSSFSETERKKKKAQTGKKHYVNFEVKGRPQNSPPCRMT